MARALACASGKHRGEALALHHLPSRMHLLGKLIQRLAKCFELGCLPTIKRGGIAAATLELIAITPALSVEAFERVPYGAIHWQVGHE